ncbi:MAG: signal peptidase I [Verrucomicrobia bacterium]|nr:MAG: signal peptidase I [Verrucomicrobiota bacterium]
MKTAKKSKQQSAAAVGNAGEGQGTQAVPPAQSTVIKPPFISLRWFISKTTREATAMHKHVHRILRAQCDLLSPAAMQSVSESLTALAGAIKSNAATAELRKGMTALEESANKWLLPYAHAAWRENVEVLLVALAVAMGIRTFFIQPFKIPTGSMQPTLYGVVSSPDFTRITSEADYQEQIKARDALIIPTGWPRVRDWFGGITYVDIKAKTDGSLDRVDDPVGIRILNFYQNLYIGGVAHTLFLPPDYGQGDLKTRAGLRLNQEFHQGDSVVRMKIQAGDHLFVDRVSYNFRKPQRGEIVVFQTAGIEESERRRWGVPGDQFYIKRMVAMSDESVKIGDDQHLVINGRRLDASTPGFENVYSGNAESGYIGHVPMQRFAEGREYHVRTNHFMVMGDNTRNSLDSRFFGDVDSNEIIGKSWFVYWPITERFGLGYR